MIKRSVSDRAGPFNSWDRTAYWNDLRGYRSTTKLDDVFDGNFIIANYGSMAAIDNDDTSAHYEARNNVFAYVRVLAAAANASPTPVCFSLLLGPMHTLHSSS